jgi:hypothetical protein
LPSGLKNAQSARHKSAQAETRPKSYQRPPLSQHGAFCATARFASAPAQGTRARQNVIFELGFFVAKLGRGHVCLLRKGEIEIPSDLYGVIYTDMVAGDGWKLGLAKELEAAGLIFDANKVWS